jgi:hypothetical protein
MTEEIRRSSVGVAGFSGHSRPANELPVLVDPGPVTWRSEAIALSVPYLLVYTAGTEFALLGSSRSSGADPGELVEEIRLGINRQGRGDGFSFRSPGLVGHSGEFRDDGAFCWRGWIPVPATGDVLMSLEWPRLGIAYSERRIAGEPIRRAAQRALILWT